MVDVPTQSTDAAVEFLTWWDEAGPRTVVAIQPTEEKSDQAIVRTASFTVDQVQEMHKWIDGYNGQWNLYFTPNRCDLSLGPPKRRPTSPEKGQITAARCLHLDLDLPKGAEGTQAEYDDLLERIRSFTPGPNAIIFSGGGYQAFWKFDQERPAGEYMERVETCNKTLLKQVDGDSSCFNINRLMRLPGTLNVLNATKKARGRVPALAYLVERNDGPGWSFETDVLPRVPQDPTLDPSAPPQSDDDESEQDDRPLTVDDLPRKIKAAIKVADVTPYGGDRSKLVWFITCALVRLKWPDEMIVDVISNSQYACSAHVLDQSNPQRYAESQVRKAKDAVATDWQRTEKGQIHTLSQINIKKALNAIGVRFGYSVFDDRYYVNGVGPLRQLDDHEIVSLRLEIDSQYGFLPVKDLFFDVVKDLAWKSKFNPVANFHAKNQPTWDGVPRLDTWLQTYAGAEDSRYARAVGRLTMIAGVRRVRQPGCKHDEMLIFITAKQGTNKSSALKILAIKEEWFSDSFPLHAKDKQVLEHLQGKWIIECSELTGMKQAQIEETKGLLSRTVDRARMAYAHLPVDVPRSCIFFGTTNSTEFLRDLENRRFWPVVIKEFDLEALERDVLQLWAEAAHYEAQGESIQLPRELWPEAALVQEAHRIEEPWTSALDEALGTWEGRILSEELWKILGKPIAATRSGPDSSRLGECMRELGWKRKQFRFPGAPNPKHCYYKGDPTNILYVFVDPMNNNAVHVGITPPAGSFETRREGEQVDNAEPPPF